MNWRLIAIPASVVPFLILFLTADVSPQDVFAVGLVPFIASAAAGLTKIMIQAFRFKYFIKNFIGYDVASTGRTVSARLAGEFVTQTTPSYVGGEFVRIAWLSKNGVAPGKAAWVTTMEIIADVFVSSMLAFIAGSLAIYRGGTFVGIAVILVTIPTFGVWLSLLLFSARRNLRLPSFAQRLMQRFMAKEKAESEALAERIAALRFVAPRKVGEHDVLYGSVTGGDIAEFLKGKGVDIDKRKILLDEPIKKLGDHDVRIKLHPEVTATLKLLVSKEG